MLFEGSMISTASPTLVEDKCYPDSVTNRRLSNSSASTESPASTPQTDTTPEPPSPDEIENASSKTHQKRNLLKRLTHHAPSSSQYTSSSSSFRSSLLEAPLRRLRNNSISRPHDLWPRKPPPPGLPGSDHPLYPSIYSLSITQRTARCTLSYTTGATAVYIGSNLWLAPARCFRFDDEVLNIMEITAAHSNTQPLDYRDLAAGRVPRLHLVPMHYLDARNAPHKPIPSNGSIDWRLDLVLLTTRTPATPPAASTAALPGRSPPGLQKVVWVGINKQVAITPYIMARYPGYVTERLLRATVEGLRPGYISVAEGRAGYGSAQPGCVRREVVGCGTDFVTYHINITDDSPGGAVGVGRGREVVGIHLACHKIGPRITERTCGEGVEAKEEPSMANVAINLDTPRFRMFARRYIVPEIHDAFLKRCWEEFADSGLSEELDEWKTPEWMQVPLVLPVDRPGVWMEYVDKRMFRLFE